MKLVNRLLAPLNTTIVSVLGFGQALIGFWLIFPFDSWPIMLAGIEPIIGLILLMIGVCISVFSLSTNMSALQWSTTAGYIFWLTTMIVMLAENPAGTGWIFSLIFAIYSFLITTNIRVNRRYVK